MDREQGGNSAAFGIDATDQMPGTLGSDHHDIDISRRDDSFEMNAESVRETENLTRMQVGFDELVVKLGLGLVGGQYMNPVSAFGGLIGGHDHHAICFGLLGAFARRVEADDYLVSAVTEILSLRVSLAAVADDCDGFALQGIGPGVPLIKNSDCHRAPLVHHSRFAGGNLPAVWERFGLKPGKPPCRPTGRSVYL